MSENTEEKPFKSLKLTSLKVAKAAPKESAPAPVDAAPAGEKASPLSLGAPRATASPTEPVEPSAPSAAATPAPALSPSAASTGPVLKPFKVLSVAPKPAESAGATEEAPKAFKPLEVKVARSAASGTVAEVVGTGAPAPTESVGEAVAGATEASSPQGDASASVAPPLPGNGMKLKAVVAVAEPAAEPAAADGGAVTGKAKAKAAVAIPSMRPLIFIGAGVLALAVILGVGLFLFGGDDAPASAPVAVAPSKSPVAPAKPVAPVSPEPGPDGGTVPTPVAPAKPVDVVAPPVSVAPATEAVSARIRRPEVVAWLDGVTVTAIAAQRLTMDGRAYSLNEIVRAEGALRWVGRDSVTGRLLFVDDAGVVYEKAARGSR